MLLNNAALFFFFISVQTLGTLAFRVHVALTCLLKCYHTSSSQLVNHETDSVIVQKGP